MRHATITQSLLFRALLVLCAFSLASVVVYVLSREGAISSYGRSAETPADGAVVDAVVTAWGDCASEDCTELSIAVSESREGRVSVVAVYEGIRDDSIRARRYVADFVRLPDGTVVLGEPVMTFACYPGRGHRDFSNERCL